MDLKKNLGENIKRYRQLKGYSQEEFSEMLDISQQTLSRIERGVNFVTAETLTKIPEILDIQLYELFKDGNSSSQNNIYENIIKNLDYIKSNKQKLEFIDKIVKDVMFL